MDDGHAGVQLSRWTERLKELALRDVVIVPLTCKLGAANGGREGKKMRSLFMR